MKHLATKLIVVLVVIILIWGTITIVDYRQVCHHFEKPIFTIPTETVDDGGSGKYEGLGYSFVIKGNFMPDDEFQGVTQARFYLFGKMITESVRE